MNDINTFMLGFGMGVALIRIGEKRIEEIEVKK